MEKSCIFAAKFKTKLKTYKQKKHEETITLNGYDPVLTVPDRDEELALTGFSVVCLKHLIFTGVSALKELFDFRLCAFIVAVEEGSADIDTCSIALSRCPVHIADGMRSVDKDDLVGIRIDDGFKYFFCNFHDSVTSVFIIRHLPFF